ncbi:TolC family protein [Myxococcus sp. AB036A]|uniref:TolC family protein n=1 Tax=Myxococcus sp. AB036A TaxID=2562793 RepID=UPI001147446B
MRLRSIRRWAWALALLLPAHAGAAERGMTEEEAVSRALQANADVRLQHAEVEAAQARLAQATLFLQANPELSAAVGPRRGTQETTDVNVQLTQSFEVAGQQGARNAAARAAMEAAQARLSARRLEVAAAVREAFGRALVAERRRVLSEEAAQLAAQSLTTAQSRLEAGDATRIEVNAARIEAGRSQAEARRAAQELSVALSVVRALLALPPGEDLRLLGELPSPAPSPDTAYLDSLVQQASSRRPELIAARKELEAARAERKLATRAAFPSLRLGAGYSREEGDQILQGVLAFDIPIFNRNQAARGEATARIAQAETALGAAERSVRQEVQLAAARLSAASASAAALAGEVREASQENLQLINEAYAAGKVDFLELLLVRQAALEARRGYLEAMEEFISARAELARASGAGMDGLSQ